MCFSQFLTQLNERDKLDEKWDFIEDWYNYIISNYGRVYNIDKAKYLKIDPVTWYPRVRLGGIHGEVFYVHRLVGRAFVDGYFEGAVINHKDGNAQNNYFENLEWSLRKKTFNMLIGLV